MSDFISQSQGFMGSFETFFSRFFDSIKQGYELLNTAISLPLELVGVLPSILGAAVSIVVFSMIIKFILGR